MISIGNDIVALNGINRQRTNDTRFHSKFITPAELSLHGDNLPLVSFVWLLWSVKESAYKYQQRLQPDLVFSPTKVVVQSIGLPQNYENQQIADTWQGNPANANFLSGNVVIQNQTLYFKSIINHGLIATVVCDDPSFQNTYWGIQKIDSTDHESQSASVRIFLLNQLQTIFPQKQLTINKTEAGYPVLLINNMVSNIPISLAHHVEFISYVFKI